MRKLFFALIPATALLIILFSIGASKIHALQGSPFQAGRIIDDAIFFNGQSLSASGAQSFLNARVPVCDTNGTQPYGSTTRAAYGTSQGYPPPYTCLKDYRQDTPAKGAEAGLCNTYPGGNKSAAEIIYEVGVSCGISQRSMIVLLEKEQSLVTDDWPWSIQYRSATGYGCPDTAACDAEYYGFFNQVYNAARQFKRYSRDSSLFRYRPYRDNFIQYNPNASCGGTNVYIQNQATAGLYNYTPYQPNPSALNNLYGTGDGCGAYGNRNFWRIHYDWFGPTIDDANYWVLIRHPSDGRYFIATSFAVHYIPNQQTLDDWGIASLEPVTVPLEFITSRTYGSPLNRLLRDSYGNIFLMDGGKKHYVRDTKYLTLWQQDINSAVTIHGLSFFVSDGEWLGHCGKSLSTPSNVWVINAVNKYAASSPLQAAWGCGALSTISLTDNFLANYPTSGNASYFVMNGSTPFVVNQSMLWTNNDQSIVNYYKPAGESYIYLDSRLRQLFNWRTLTPFAKDTSTQQWFFVENGSKHYINNSKLADLWGFAENGGLSSLSNDLLGVLGAGSNLSPLARTAVPNSYYILGGDKKHYLPDQTAIDEWSKPGTTVELMPNNVLDRYSSGANITEAAGKSSSGAYFLAQEGRRLELWHPNLVNAWGQSYVPVSNRLYSYLDADGIASYIARDGTSYFYLESDTKYSVPASLDKSWGLSVASTILPQTLSRYTLGSKVMTSFISLNGKTYSLLNFKKTELSSSLASIVPSNQFTSLSKDYFPSNPKSTHLLRSSDMADNRLWLVATNGKILLPSTAHALNLGYISKSIELTLLAPEALDAIPVSPNTASFLIQSPGGAFKLLSFGEALSLPDSQTAQAYINITGSVSPVSQEIFNLFSLSRTATRLIRDDSGKVYWIDGGTKRWIINDSHLSTTFAGIPQTYLHSTLTTLIPNGAVIN